MILEKTSLLSQAPARHALAMDGGEPVRAAPLPPEWPGLHYYGAEEAELVGRVVEAASPFRYYGPDLQRMTDQFEGEFAAFLGVNHVLGVNSGTSALTAAMMALGVGPGTEVIVPGYLWVSTVSAVVRLGAVPVLADIDETFCLDPADVERKITPRTRAVAVVHMSGASGHIQELVRLCRARGIFLLEDVAQAAGARVNGRALGSFGDIAIFSFQLNKTMTTGEGGAIATNLPELFARAFAAHDLGYARNAAGRLELEDLSAVTWGCGSRMNELTAALALAQLRKLPEICEAMRTRKAKIKALLADIPGLAFRVMDDPPAEAGNFLLTIFPRPEVAAYFVRALRAEGIVTGKDGISNILMRNWGMHVYSNIPALVRKLGVSGGNNPWKDARNPAGPSASYVHGTLPRCDDLMSRSTMLAIPPNLTDEDIQDIGRAFHKVAAACPPDGFTGQGWGQNA